MGDKLQRSGRILLNSYDKGPILILRIPISLLYTPNRQNLVRGKLHLNFHDPKSRLSRLNRTIALGLDSCIYIIYAMTGRQPRRVLVIHYGIDSCIHSGIEVVTTHHGWLGLHVGRDQGHRGTCTE